MAVLDLPRTPSAADLALALARRHLRQVYAFSGPWRGRTASARPCHPGGSQDPLRPPAGRPGRAFDAVGGGYGRHRARARSTVALPLGGRSVRATSTQWRVPRSATGHPPSPPRTLNPSQHALGLVASSGAVRRGAVTEPGRLPWPRVDLLRIPLRRAPGGRGSEGPAETACSRCGEKVDTLSAGPSPAVLASGNRCRPGRTAGLT
jgi:hypothetical protein